eukprot:CAMPEP_0176187712 /NCGR_PEP_ID=MMETSP0121_2-20121125/2535_1 /TAXON_ID=160619 /ORGANISM="Kryptoperidinium foliaceum, Strain CCMP 1326" /LENGTH=213 /DNA_ID=CAMNT_0017526253 /DNA_START=172 /DNA_END=813 /DNA_ORIENTATION=+
MTRADGTRSPLMELPKTRAPYIVLESMTRERSDMIRSVHVMSLAEKPLTLGRSHENALRIADVSISRCHARVSCVGGRFFLQDNRSKFGTLVAMRRPHLIEASRPLSVQVGRTVLSLSLSVPMVAPSPEVMNAVSSSLVAAATVSRPPSVAPMVSVLSTASLEEARQQHVFPFGFRAPVSGTNSRSSGFVWSGGNLGAAGEEGAAFFHARMSI